MEEEEALEPGALVSKLANTVKDKINNLLADGVVTPGVVVGRVLLAGDELLGVEELPVGPDPDLVNDRGLEVNKHGPGHVFPRPRLREEGGKGVISNVGIFLAIIISSQQTKNHDFLPPEWCRLGEYHALNSTTP